MLHPSLLTRVILTAILTVLGTVLCLIPFPKYDHVAVRFATSAAGSFGLVLAIALLADIPAWSNVWARFLANNDIEWGTVKEKGLSAAYCFLLALGMASDWLLHRFFGANPDEVCLSLLLTYRLCAHDCPRNGTITSLNMATAYQTIQTVQEPSKPLNHFGTYCSTVVRRRHIIWCPTRISSQKISI